IDDALERLYALPEVDATDDDVQIMTIHKAKGLEFGTVIVPGLDLGPGGWDTDLLLFNEKVGGRGNGTDGEKGRRPREGGDPVGGLLLAPIKATGADEDPTYKYLSRLNTEAEDVESSRLLYVAATRAENRLHLLACLGCDKDGELKRPTAHTLLSRAWPVPDASFHADQQTDLIEPEFPADIYSINRLAASVQLPSLPNPATWTAPPESRDEEQIEFSWAGETARRVGMTVHYWLRRMGETTLESWTTQTI